MAQRELVLLRLPEFPEPGIDREIVLDACGPTPDEIEKLIERNEERLAAEEAERMEEEEEEEEYESVSDEEKSIVGAYLLDVTADDPDEYTEPMQELILAMADGGVDLLAESVDERAGEAVSGGLLAGLNPEVVKRVACAWAANLGYEAPAEASMGGWYGDILELRDMPIPWLRRGSSSASARRSPTTTRASAPWRCATASSTPRRASARAPSVMR